MTATFVSYTASKTLKNALLIFCSLVLLWATTINAGEKLGGNFSLTTHKNEPFSLDSIKGKVGLVFFGFTHCPDVCPDTLGRINVLMSNLEDKSQDIQPLFITVDPERDTPEVLATYVKYFHPSILGLTGTTEQIDKVIKQYRSNYSHGEKNESGAYSVNHSSNLYVIGRDGELAQIIQYGTPQKMMEQRVLTQLEQS